MQDIFYQRCSVKTQAWIDCIGTLLLLMPVTGFIIWSSWEYVADAFETKPSWKAGGIWAPDVTFYNEKYYLFYSLSVWGDPNPGIGLATATTPLGPFEDQGKVLDSESSGVDNSIDPFFYFEGEGRNKKFYLFWGSFRGIYGIEMNSSLTDFIGEKFRIGGNMFEATVIYKKNTLMTIAQKYRLTGLS